MKQDTPVAQPVIQPVVQPAEGLCEPLSVESQRRLRRAVVEQARTTGRTVRPVLHVGEPAGVEVRIDLDELGPTDLGLRTDLVSTMLDTVATTADTDSSGPPLVWLTRGGDLAVQDVDAAWLAAARAAGQETGRPLVMVVVTRRGWRDPRSGLTRSWVRLRLPRAPGRD